MERRDGLEDFQSWSARQTDGELGALCERAEAFA
jgi:hypothetical protein